MSPRERPSPESLIREWGPEAARCSRCGFCQPTCPIYRETGREAHVARGKSFLLRKMAEDQLELEPGLREAFDNCLLCRACTANCFPAVRTDQMVMAFREAYAGRWGRPLVQRLLFRNVLPHPATMSRLFALAFSSRLPSVGRRAQQRGLLTLLNPKMDMAMRLAPRAPRPFLRERLARMDLGAADGALRVGYWISCGYNYMLPEVGVSTVRVLRALGAQVVPLENACCGLPVQSYGDGESARALARENLRRVERAGTLDFIVSECGSCSSHLKEYGGLLGDDERWATRASAFAARVRSFSELLVELDAELPLASLPRTVTYHEPCHMTARYQGVVRQPRDLISRIPGVGLVEMEEADSCCGAAGSYNVLHPEVSSGILRRKTRNIAATGASCVVSECPSCVMQLTLGVRDQHLPVSVLGISQLIDEAMVTSGARAGPTVS
jgi:glycolate oxidase iron-sulfur subunit